MGPTSEKVPVVMSPLYRDAVGVASIPMRYQVPVVGSTDRPETLSAAAGPVRVPRAVKAPEQRSIVP